MLSLLHCWMLVKLAKLLLNQTLVQPRVLPSTVFGSSADRPLSSQSWPSKPSEPDYTIEGRPDSHTTRPVQGPDPRLCLSISASPPHLVLFHHLGCPYPAALRLPAKTGHRSSSRTTGLGTSTHPCLLLLVNQSLATDIEISIPSHHCLLRG